MPITVDSVEEKIMKEMSADMDIPYSLIREVVINGQSAFTKHIMESGQYSSVRWPYFGTFKVKVHHAQVKKYMRGLTSFQRDLLKIRIKEGHVFERKFDKK